MESNTKDNEAIPNAARVYDYVLGGHHNFDADRQAAEYMLGLVPSTRKWVRYLRIFLHETVHRLAEEGFDRFLDLASGLPTEEHIHTTAPNAHVVYVDNDPLVVETGTRIIGDRPFASYVEGDIRDIHGILESEAARGLVKDGRKVAVGLNGVTCFLTEEDIRGIATALFDWAPRGSKLYATFETKQADLMTPKMQRLLDMFAQIGSPYYFLTLEKSRALMKPWIADDPGFLPLAEVLGLAGEITEADREDVGLEFYGAVFAK